MIIVIALVGGLIMWGLSRRFHRKTVAHEANVVAKQPLTEFAARFPKAPKGRNRRLGGF